jgi:tetratricopeptide (TPR) repeat protein
LQEIADEISRSMDVLTVAKRTGKHRSMTAVLDPSWQLLSSDEQQAMQHLSVFRGSFTRELARQVAGIALTTLAQLVSKSMLRRAEGNRYDLHELMRQFAGAQLQKHGDENEARRKHALAYTALIESIEPAFYGPLANQRVSELEPERANFRAALEWSAGLNGDPAVLMRLAAALMRYFYMLPDWHQGDHWLREALKRKGDVNDGLLTARVQLGLGMMEHAWCNFDTALGDLDQALATFEARDQTWHVAWTLSQMMECHYGAGRVEPCEALAQRSLTLFRQINDAWGTAYVTWQTGHNALYKGELDRAAALAQESFQAFERLGDPICPVLAANLLATVAVNQQRYDEAREHFLWGVQRCLSRGVLAGAAWGTQELAEVALMQRDATEARRRFREAIPMRYDVGDLVAVHECIQGMGIAAAQAGDAAEAARWFGMASQDKRGDGLLMKPWLKQQYEEAVASARAALDEDQWRAAWDAGRANSLPAVVAEARARVGYITSPHPTSPA